MDQKTRRPADRPDLSPDDLAGAIAPLGLRVVASTPTGWEAEADGDRFLVTYAPVTQDVPWDVLRDRVTRLMSVEHEHLVPLLAAAPVTGGDTQHPRGAALVWERPGMHLDELVERTGLTLGHVVGALVAAGRAIAALHAHDLAAGPGDLLAALRVGEDGNVRHLPDGGLAAQPVSEDPQSRGEAVRALARAGHGLLARAVTPDGAARDLAHLLAATGLDPQTEPPAPGTLAAMCLEIHLPALAADWARLVAPQPDPEPPAPLVAPPAEAALTLDQVDVSARTWREHIEQQPAPAQGRRRAVTPAPSRSRRAEPQSDRLGAGAVGSLRTMLPAPRNRGRSRRRLLVGAAAALALGSAVGALELRGSAPADGTSGIQVAGTPASSSTPPALPAAGPDTNGDQGATGEGATTSADVPSPDRPDPSTAAAALTTHRAELLAGVRPTGAVGADARRSELVTALRAVHTDGPSLAADLALVDRLLDGQSTVPEVTTEVVGTTVVDVSPDAATVAVDYRIVDAWGTAQERSVRLTLVWEDDAWLVETVSAAG